MDTVNTVGKLLDAKGRDIWSVRPDASVLEAVRTMADREVGALMVMDESAPVGIISERDYARKVILEGRSSKDTRVEEIMTKRLIYADPGQSVAQCLSVMTDKRIRHLPIMDAGHLVGVISIGDLVKAIIAEQKFIIDQLERYISG